MPASKIAQPLPELIRPDTWLAQTWASAQKYRSLIEIDGSSKGKHIGTAYDSPSLEGVSRRDGVVKSFSNATPRYIGRFAPSPSGKLHQGSLIAALASYLHARWHGGVWRVRMEDVDQSRCTRAIGAHQLATLRALGFEFDEPVLWQTERFAAYRAVFAQLRAHQRVYPCVCTRREIAEQQAQLGVAYYPRTCRNGMANSVAIRSWRFDVGNEIVTWTDESGQISTERLSETSGDFVIRRGAQDTDDWAYQLAVVEDDAAQGVTHVVRGADLFDSTARQIALQRALGYPTPQYSHVPLLTNAYGEKLSKSEQAPELDTFNSLAALQHAWRFLGGVDFDCADVADFWARISCSA